MEYLPERERRLANGEPCVPTIGAYVKYDSYWNSIRDYKDKDGNDCVPYKVDSGGGYTPGIYGESVRTSGDVWVRGHWRSAPNDTVTDNYSYNP